MSYLLVDWVELIIKLSVTHGLPNSAWGDGNLAEVAGQLVKIVEHPNQSDPNPGPQADRTPCSSIFDHEYTPIIMAMCL